MTNTVQNDIPVDILRHLLATIAASSNSLLVDIFTIQKEV